MKNSSSQDILDTTKFEYEDALKKLGYNLDLKYTNNKSKKPKTQVKHMLSPTI